MRTAKRLPRFYSLGAAARPVAVALALLVPAAIPAAEGVKVDPRAHLGELARLGARKPFLTDSPDVYLEPRSLNRFFTVAIYRRLEGNAYFGYHFDEGFAFEGKTVQIEVLGFLRVSTASITSTNAIEPVHAPRFRATLRKVAGSAPSTM